MEAPNGPNFGIFSGFPSGILVTLKPWSACIDAMSTIAGAHIMKSTLNRRAAMHLIALAAALPLAGAIPCAAAQDTPVAIKGYDPVAYFTLGKPTKGNSEFAYDWDDHHYLFASAEHRDLFKANPVRYAPQFGNYCAMALAKGQIVVANPENWLISDGKLYVFGSPAPAGPVLFGKDLAGNVVKANQNRTILPKD
jgi:YHS domain-containing protein